MSYFYSDVIKIEEIVVELEGLELEDHHKTHLAQLVDSMIHQVVLDSILEKLSPEDKMIFLAKFSDNPKDNQLLDFLNGKIDNAHGLIVERVTVIQQEIIEDIRKAKQEFKKGEKNK